MTAKSTTKITKISTQRRLHVIRYNKLTKKLLLSSLDKVDGRIISLIIVTLLFSNKVSKFSFICKDSVNDNNSQIRYDALNFPDISNKHTLLRWY